ncbi:MAG: alkaline phosphatase, partial [Lentisphaeria bacterium]
MKLFLYISVLFLIIICPLQGTKNIILMIPDGVGHANVTLARNMVKNALALDPYLCGAVNTSSANSNVTDSAAAATAYATGQRTNNGYVGVNCDFSPLPSLAEIAKLNNKLVGIVTTDELFGATPAGFSAHVTHRSEGENIIEQLVYQDFHVVMGGGRRLLKPHNRNDKENLIEEIKKLGYSYIETKEQLDNVNKGKIWGCFNDGIITPVLNGGSEPSLKNMTKKAIEAMKNHHEGFFLMVEGAQPDKGNHLQDAIYATSEFLAFDAAVAVALEFAKKNEDTLVIIVSDHETGGLTLVKNSGRENNRKESYDKMSLTNTAIAKKVGNIKIDLPKILKQY